MSERRYVIESDGFIIGAHDPPYRILPVTKVAAIEYATTSSTASVFALVPLSELEAMERELKELRHFRSIARAEGKP